MNKNTLQTDLNYPIFNKEFETFSFKKLDSVKGFSVLNLPDGTIEEYQTQPDGFITRVQPSNSYFTLIKKFYGNGNIESKGLIFNSGDFEKGKWYFFDNVGRLTKEEDNDASYTYSFEQLYTFLKKEKIPLEIGHIGAGFHTTIRKNIVDGKPQWIVIWLKDASRSPNITEVIFIDGRSGRIIKKEERKYINN